MADGRGHTERVLIRSEGPGDLDAIRAVHAAAFRDKNHPDRVPDEVELVDQLRNSTAWLPTLSIVAALDGSVVGHCLTTRAHIGDAQVLGLGPIGVLPEHQRGGVGSALVEATIATADERGEVLIGLLGDPQFYRRFGFVVSTELHIAPSEPSWARFFQVRPLAAFRAGVTGVLRYAAPFEALESEQLGPAREAR